MLPSPRSTGPPFFAEQWSWVDVAKSVDTRFVSSNYRVRFLNFDWIFTLRALILGAFNGLDWHSLRDRCKFCDQYSTSFLVLVGRIIFSLFCWRLLVSLPEQLVSETRLSNIEGMVEERTIRWCFQSWGSRSLHPVLVFACNDFRHEGVRSWARWSLVANLNSSFVLYIVVDFLFTVSNASNNINVVHDGSGLVSSVGCWYDPGYNFPLEDGWVYLMYIMYPLQV
jgi:hypothetical protein